MATFQTQIQNVNNSNALANRPSWEKFCGRNQLITFQDSRFQAAVNQLKEFSGRNISNERCWQNFSVVVSDFLQHLQDPSFSLRVYQVDLIREIIIPYLSELKGRSHTDPDRVNQLTDIMATILIARNDEHPSNCLNSLEVILRDVNRKAYLFQSKLSTSMQRAIHNQWQPILADNRNFLQNLGGKLLFLGLLGVIGWPLIFMYPMITHSHKLLRILNEFDTSRRISKQSIFDLASMMVMMFVCSQLTNILSTYMSFGYTAGTIGVVILVMAQSEAFLKQVSPTMAAHAPMFDSILALLDSGDYKQLLTTVNNRRNPDQNQFPTSNQVEELSEDQEPPQEEPQQQQPEIDSGAGMRQRKKPAAVRVIDLTEEK
jgi:hypothetical protein